MVIDKFKARPPRFVVGRQVCRMAVSGLIAAVLCAPSVFAAEPNLVGRVIVVDAGHGGPDSGARGHGGLHEKDITLPLAHYLADDLRQQGAIVRMTRVEDDDLASDEDRARGRRHSSDLRRRYEVATQAPMSAFVSIHCNAHPNSSWRGAQTIYMAGNDEGQRLAELMQKSFAEELLPTSRSADDMANLYLLKRIKGPAVLAEVGFVSNPVEAEHLRSAAYQQTIALAMASAVLTYFGEPAPQPKEPAVAGWRHFTHSIKVMLAKPFHRHEKPS